MPNFFLRKKEDMADFITRELWIYRVFDPYFLSTSLHLDVEAIYVTSATDLF